MSNSPVAVMRGITESFTSWISGNPEQARTLRIAVQLAGAAFLILGSAALSIGHATGANWLLLVPHQLMVSFGGVAFLASRPFFENGNTTRRPAVYYAVYYVAGCVSVVSLMLLGALVGQMLA